MALFQKSVLQKHLANQDQHLINQKYELFSSYFSNSTIQANILASKEEEFQEGFLRELFVKIFDYTINPEPDFNLKTEVKNQKDKKKADGAIINGEKVLAVIELKSSTTTDLNKIEIQAFNYKNNQKDCRYIITSNFQKIRFYIDNAIEFLEWDLFKLNSEQFSLLFLCFYKGNILNNLPATIKSESITEEENITKKLYKEYSTFRKELFNNIVEKNTQFDKLLLFKKTQKLLDRFLFLLFAEDRNLVPPNSVRVILDQWTELKEAYDEYQPLYERFKKYFGYLNDGFISKQHEIFAYNGGLFAKDEILDTIEINDSVLYNATLSLSRYDYNSEIDVNILGHIFEHSLTEIEELEQAIITGDDSFKDSKRKKDGVFYTPKYITKFIVENTIGRLCEIKKQEFGVVEEEYVRGRRNIKTQKPLLKKLNEYKEWLLNITILDPACGSGAFLNQALDYLINEHSNIAYLESVLTKRTFADESVKLIEYNVEAHILENNLFGVDINEESIEIAKLSLWLRTAKKGRKLTSLNNNIKCGNSLIDDPKIDNFKAFNWSQEFSNIFKKGGFDVVIGNPPYGALLSDRNSYLTKYGFTSKSDSYQLFCVLSSALIKQDGVCGLIIPNSWMNRKGGSEFRQLLFNYKFYLVIDFVNQVFEDANIDTCIIVYSKADSKDRNYLVKSKKVFQPATIFDNLDYNEVNFRDWFKYDKFNCEFNAETFRLFDKIFSGSTDLGALTVITGGYKPYQVGYGKSIYGDFPQTKMDVENWVYHSDKKIDESYFPDIKGANIHSYYIKPNSQWVKWGSWLMSPKKIEDFLGPKIVVREVAGKRLNACFDSEGYFTNDTTHMIRGEDDGFLKSILAIINSTFMGWFFRKFYGESNDLFPKIKVNELKELPIKDGFLAVKDKLSTKVDLIQGLNVDFNKQRDSFLKFLVSKYNISKFSTKIENWFDLSFVDFIAEIKKQKIKLSLQEESEWFTFFEQEKQKALTIKIEIDKTDKEIDQLVYQLYGLSDEEIKIVEKI